MTDWELVSISWAQMKTLFPGGEHGFGNRRLALGDMWRVQAEGGGFPPEYGHLWLRFFPALTCVTLLWHCPSLSHYSKAKRHEGVFISPSPTHLLDFWAPPLHQTALPLVPHHVVAIPSRSQTPLNLNSQQQGMTVTAHTSLKLSLCHHTLLV